MHSTATDRAKALLSEYRYPLTCEFNREKYLRDQKAKQVRDDYRFAQMGGAA